MFVYGSLDMAGLEVLSALPVTGLWNGRIVKVGDQVFVYGASGWSTVSVPPINDPLIEGQILSNDGVKPIWVEQYPDMTAHTNHILRSDGVDDVFWDPQYPVGNPDDILHYDGAGGAYWTPQYPAGNIKDILHYDGLGGAYWTPQYPDMTGHQFHVLVSDGVDQAYWTPQYPDMTGLTNWILRTNGIDYVFWDAQYPDQTGHTGQFLQTDGNNTVAWADPPTVLPAQNPGDAGKYLRTNGIVSSWEFVIRSDLDAGTPDWVVFNNASTGLLDEEQYLNQIRGGFGQDVSAFDGVVRATLGVFSASPIVPGDLPLNIPADNIGSGNVDDAEFERITDLGRYEATAGITGWALSINADPTKFDISAGDGVIMDYVTNPHEPIFHDVVSGAQTAVPVANLLTADVTYLLIDQAGLLSQQTTFPTPDQMRDNIYIGRLLHPSRATIQLANSNGNHNESLGNHVMDFWNAVGPFNMSGNTIGPNGANLTFQKSSGFMFSPFFNQVSSPKNPHRVPISAAAPVSFGYRTQSNLGGTPANVTLIDPTRYDLGGVPTLVGGTTSTTVQRVFLMPTGEVLVQYGQFIYTNLAQALANMGQEPFITKPGISGFGILIGYIVVQQNATVLNNVATARVFSASRFEVGPAAGALPSTTQQQAYDNSLVPMIILSADPGPFNLRDAAIPLGIDLFSVTDFAGTAKYIQVDVEGIKSNMIAPSLVLVSDGNGAIVSNTGGVTSTELAFLDGITGLPIQAQLDAKMIIGGGLAQAGAATTTSLQLFTVLTDPTGTGLAVFNAAPLLLTPEIDNGASFVHEVAPTQPAAGHTLLYPKADNKWYSKDSSNNELPVGGGLLPLGVAAGPITGAPGTHYLANTTGGAFTINLPAGTAGASFKFTDAAETWNTNNLTIAPFTGQKIDMLAIDETLVCNVQRGWVELNWNGSYWVFGSFASVTTPPASATTPGTINYYQEDDTTLAACTFQGSLGGAASAGVAIKITRIGRMVTIDIPSFTTVVPLASSTYLGSNTMLPTWARPASIKNALTIAYNNGNYVTTGSGQVNIIPAGQIQFYKDLANTAYANSVNAGWYHFQITYTV